MEVLPGVNASKFVKNVLLHVRHILVCLIYYLFNVTLSVPDLGLEFLNTNQDLVALAEIKKMALNNKEHIEALKRELAILARQNKPAFTGVVTQSPVLDSSVLDTIREHLTDLQTEQEKLAVTADRQHSEVVDDLARKKVDHNKSLAKEMQQQQLYLYPNEKGRPQRYFELLWPHTQLP